MPPVFVLVHSPSVGPLTWVPVAERLGAQGYGAIVPSLLDVAEAGPPFWPRSVDNISAAISGLEPGQPVVLAAHSNAGVFVPVLLAALRHPVPACLFVDAALPATSGSTPVVPPELLAVLRGKVVGGRLPPWTDWFDEQEVAPMFPDAQTRAAVTAEQPRLPLAYYEQRVPAPAGWDNLPCGYLLFGPPYDEMAADARQRGWLVEELPGLHLHQINEPGDVTERLLTMTRCLAGTPG